MDESVTAALVALVVRHMFTHTISKKNKEKRQRYSCGKKLGLLWLQQILIAKGPYNRSRKEQTTF